MAKIPVPRKPLSLAQTHRAIDRLFDHYGVDRSPGRDRAKDGEMYFKVIFDAVCDGLLKVPDKKGASNRGAPSKWKGKLGVELLHTVAIEVFKALERKQYTKKPSITKALKALQDQDPQKWGCYDLADLKKRYYETKKYWDRRPVNSR